MGERLTLLDACAVVGLYATRKVESILNANGEPFGMVGIVATEAQHVFRGGSGPDSRDREPIDLTPLTDSGVITIFNSNDDDELQTFIDLTQELGDGEALTAAIAIHRNWTVVTDDRKAERILLERGVRVRSTVELIRVWFETTELTPEECRGALIDLRQRATYEPGRNHLYRSWWDAILYS